MVENRRTYLKKWGNSQGIMIPKDVLMELGIQDYKNQNTILASHLETRSTKHKYPQTKTLTNNG